VIRPRVHDTGFTLIEVLAALVIVALGMLGVIEAVTQAARNGTYLREKTLAHWIAMNVITERRLGGSQVEVGETSGDLEFANQDWHWTLRVTQTQVESMRRMEVSVRAAEARDGTSLATATGFYGTAIGQAGGMVAWAGTGGPGGAGDGNGDEEGGNGDDENNGDDTGDDGQPNNPPPTDPDVTPPPPDDGEDAE
jgi:general secretion pathway protein I